MRLQRIQIDSLPSLAWCAEVKDGLTTVIHGPQVEAVKDWFVEGAWSGDFAQGKFTQSEWFCGTGGRVEQDNFFQLLLM